MITHVALGLWLAATDPAKKSEWSYIDTIGIAMVSSAGFWGLVTWLLGVRERRRKLKQDTLDAETKKKAEAEEKQRRDEEFHDLLSRAQTEAQRTALLSADSRYAALHADYTRCLDGLKEVRKTSFLILDALDGITSKFQKSDDGNYTTTMTGEEMMDTRSSIRDARIALYQF